MARRRKNARDKVKWHRERDPHVKGSYRRKLDDAYQALDLLKIPEASEELAFLFNYMACEKVAKIITRMMGNYSSIGHEFNRVQVRENMVREACVSLNFDFSKRDCEMIFAEKDGSARSLRNKLFHDMGPTQVTKIVRHAQRLNKTMHYFLECRKNIILQLDFRAKGDEQRRDLGYHTGSIIK